MHAEKASTRVLHLLFQRQARPQNLGAGPPPLVFRGPRLRRRAPGTETKMTDDEPVSGSRLPSRSAEYVPWLVHLTESAGPNVKSYSLVHTYIEHSIEASALTGIRCLTRHSGCTGIVT